MAIVPDVELGSKDEVTATHVEAASDSGEKLEVVRTISRVENENYYEKGGLRTEGDGLDHSHFTPVSKL
jgi:hypothetical protein